MKGNAWQFAVVALALALVFPALNVTFQGATATRSVTNESVTIDFSVNSTVDAADEALSFNATVTIFNSSDHELVAGTDYIWNDTSGEIDWRDTNNTTSGESATVSYQYTFRHNSTERSGKLLRSAMSWIGLLVLVTGLGFLLVLIWGGGGGR